MSVADSLIKRLNDQQREVVLNPGNVSVVSIPGSGKTTLLIAKIAHILSQSEDTSVCAVTFTKKAAEEMRERLSKSLGYKPPEKRLLIKTFNALGLWQLRKAKIPTKRIIHDSTIRSVIKNSLIKYAGEASASDSEVNEYMQKISAVKSSRKVREAGGNPEVYDPDDELLPLVFAEYQKHLSAGDMMDFSDQVLLTVNGLYEGKVPPLPYTHLLVDEYQDSDELQVDWTIFHAQKGVITTVVGDDDQSIYSFRGGSGYEGFRLFEEQAPNVTRIVLNKNYRSYQEILDVSAKLIDHNKSRIPKKLVANNGYGAGNALVEVLEEENLYEEVLRLCDIITRRKEENPDETWAALFRTNTDMMRFEQVLQHLNIPYESNSKTNPLNFKMINAYLTILESISTSMDKAAFDILTLYGINAKSLEFHMDKQGLKSYYDFCFVDIEKFIVSMSDQDKKKWKMALEAAAGLPEMAKYVAIGHVTPLLRFTLKNVIEKHPEYNEERFAPLLDTIFHKLKSYSSTIRARVHKLKEVYSRDKSSKGNDEKEQKGAIQLITMHSAKGLEFDNVILPFCNEGFIPSSTLLDNLAEEPSKQKRDAMIEEERRLFYVAMTRAKKRLYVSHHLAKFSPFIPFQRYLSLRDNNIVEKMKAAAAHGSGVEVAPEDIGVSSNRKSKVYALVPTTPSRFLGEAGMIAPRSIDEEDSEHLPETA